MVKLLPRWSTRIWASVAVMALALPGCDQPLPPSVPSLSEARPAMWKIKDTDTVIYLFGTVHMLPEDLVWDGGKVGEAIAASQSLMLELSGEQMARVPDIINVTATDEPRPPVRARIKTENVAAFERIVANTGLSLHRLDRLEDWAVALLLSQRTGNRSGLSATAGVEANLTHLFTRQKKPVEGLETAFFQMSLFDDLPQRAQTALLDKAIADHDQSGNKARTMIAAWARGDQKAIEAYAESEIAAIPEIVDTLIARRNERWAEWIAGRLGQPGTMMLAVGAGHLVGDHALQTVLAARGITAVRVQ